MFPYDVARIISSYAWEYILHEKMDIRDIMWRNVSGNPRSYDLLLKFDMMIDWTIASGNSGAIRLLLANPDKIDWDNFSKNTHPDAIPLLRANLDKVYWGALTRNRNPMVIPILRDNIGKVELLELSENPNAIGMMKKVFREAKYDREIVGRYIDGTNPHPVSISIFMECYGDYNDDEDMEVNTGFGGMRKKPDEKRKPKYYGSISSGCNFKHDFRYDDNDLWDLSYNPAIFEKNTARITEILSGRKISARRRYIKN